jgi:hypothetical protein
LTDLAAQLAGQHSKDLVNAIRRDLLGYVAGGELADDATAIAIRRQRADESPGDIATDFVRTDSFPG